MSVSRWWLGWIVALVTVGRLPAHEPFDVSTHVTVSAEHIELVSTLGVEGAREIMIQAGFAPERIAASLQSREAMPAAAEQTSALTHSFYAMRADDQPLTPTGASIRSEGAEILIALKYPRPAAKALTIEAKYYEAAPALHNGVLSVEDESAGRLGTALLSRERTMLSVALPKAETSGPAAATTSISEEKKPQHAVAETTAPVAPSFAELFKLGVEHIVTGFDHLLFLAALLIGLRQWRRMVGVITCFTVAHSVTLALATLNLVVISSRIVEPAIAVSIIVVCLLNLAREGAEGDRLWLAGAFGLIHGFGFAAALRETGFGGPGTSIAMPLFAFNLGVECGQLAIAAIFLPLLFRARRLHWFVRYGTPAISTCVIAISGYWVVDRVMS